MELEPGLISSVPDGVYDPREDTFLLLRAIEVLSGDRTALEVGCGNGLISLHLSKIGLAVDSTDINDKALDFLSRRSETG